MIVDLECEGDCFIDQYGPEITQHEFIYDIGNGFVLLKCFVCGNERTWETTEWLAAIRS